MSQTCRHHFTVEDLEFVLEILAKDNETQRKSIEVLWVDDDSRDSLLLDEKVYHALIDGVGCLKVSSWFYFYVIMRRFLIKNHQDDSELADYLASMLVIFSRNTRIHYLSNTSYDPAGFPYIVDFLAMLSQIGDRAGYKLRTHIANYSLFLTGIFPDKIHAHRERRGGPDIEFYVNIGRSNYHVVSHHRLAAEEHLDKTFNELCEKFDRIRCTLNDISDRVFHLTEATPTLSGQGLILSS